MASRWNRNASFIRYTLHNVSSVWIVQSWFSFYADRLNENSCSCLSLLLRGITSVFNNTTGNTVCQSLCFLYRGRITQIQSLFYAFRGIEAHENQGFSATVGGQAGQIIQSLSNVGKHIRKRRMRRPIGPAFFVNQIAENSLLFHMDFWNGRKYE